jgi:hypothetical protein
MIGIVETLINVVKAFGSLVAWGAITAVNGFFHAVELLIRFLFDLLPHMPTLATYAPSWLTWANWFFPFGALVAAFTGMLVVFLLYLLQRYILKLIRAL